jgi:hypothetical protein
MQLSSRPSVPGLGITRLARAVRTRRPGTGGRPERKLPTQTTAPCPGLTHQSRRSDLLTSRPQGSSPGAVQGTTELTLRHLVQTATPHANRGSPQ